MPRAMYLLLSIAMLSMPVPWLVAGCVSPGDFDGEVEPDPIPEEPYPTVPWEGAGWSRRVRIGLAPALLVDRVADESEGAYGDLENFPLLVRLVDDDVAIDLADPQWSSATDLTVVDFQLLVDKGVDLRFSTASNFAPPGLEPAAEGYLLAHEIESIDLEAQTARVWVRVPRLVADAATDHLWLHYGNPAAPPLPAAAGAVWTRDYAAVWHMNKTGDVVDAGRDGNDAEAYAQQTLVPGWLGGLALAFGEHYGEGLGLDAIAGSDRSLTVHAVVTTGLGEADGRPQHNWTRHYVRRDDSFELNEVVDQEGAMSLSFVVSTVNGERAGVRTDAVELGRYLHVVGRYDADEGAVDLFLDGESAERRSVRPSRLLSGRGSVSIGGNLVGNIDELHLSRVARSSERIRAEAAGYAGELTLSGAVVRDYRANDIEASQTASVVIVAPADGESDTFLLATVTEVGVGATPTGFSLEWGTPIATQCTADGSQQLTLWAARGDATALEPFSVAFDAPSNGVVGLVYLQGVSGAQGWYDPVTFNVAGENGACSSEVAARADLGATFVRTERHGRMLRFVATGGKELGETPAGFQLLGARNRSTDAMGLAAYTARWSPEKSVELGGTLGDAAQWAQIVIELAD